MGTNSGNPKRQINQLVVEAVIRVDGKALARVLAMAGIRQTPIGVDDGLASSLLYIRRLQPRLPNRRLPRDRRKPQPDPGEPAPPESRDRPFADGAAGQLSHYRLPATRYDAHD